jgi:hypothetical protein
MMKYAFFEDFKGSDSILFDGTIEDLRHFAGLLDRVASGDLVGEIALDESNGFQPMRKTQMKIATEGELGSGAGRTLIGDSIQIVWKLSSSDAVTAAELVRGLVDYNDAGHQYLEESGDLQLILSYGEYPERIFESD